MILFCRQVLCQVNLYIQNWNYLTKNEKEIFWSKIQAFFETRTLTLWRIFPTFLPWNLENRFCSILWPQNTLLITAFMTEWNNTSLSQFQMSNYFFFEWRRRLCHMKRDGPGRGPVLPDISDLAMIATCRPIINSAKLISFWHLCWSPD